MDKLNYIMMLEYEHDISCIHDNIMIDLYTTESVSDFIRKCIDKIKSMFTKLKDFFKRIFGIKTKDRMAEIEKIIDKSPDLKNKMIEIKDVNQVQTIANKFKKQGKKVTAKEIVTGVGVTTVTIGGALLLLKKFNDKKKNEIDRQEKEAINNIEKEDKKINITDNDNQKTDYEKYIERLMHQKEGLQFDINQNKKILEVTQNHMERSRLKEKIDRAEKSIQEIDKELNKPDVERKKEYNQRIQDELDRITHEISCSEAEILVEEENIKTIEKQIEEIYKNIENKIQSSDISDTLDIRKTTRQGIFSDNLGVKIKEKETYRDRLRKKYPNKSIITVGIVNELVDYFDKIDTYIKNMSNTAEISKQITFYDACSNLLANAIAVILDDCLDVTDMTLESYEDKIKTYLKNEISKDDPSSEQYLKTVLNDFKTIFSYITKVASNKLIVLPKFDSIVEKAISDKVKKYNIEIIDKETYEKSKSDPELKTKITKLENDIDEDNKKINKLNKELTNAKRSIDDNKTDINYQNKKYDSLKKSLAEI